MLEVMYMYVRGIEFAAVSFDITISIWNYSDGVIQFVFHSISCL